MQKCADAATHIKANKDSIKILFPKDCKDSINHIESMANLKTLNIFNNEVCEFLSALSKMILSDKECKAYPDIISFGFFIRASNLSRLKSQYESNLDSRLGRGLSFHIAPSNVPINFAFSLIASLLAGNANVVRVSSKDFAQTRIICRLLSQIHSRLKKYICIVQYPHEREINDFLSLLADNRIIWGGDSTISILRLSSLKPRAIELSFANRYSLCVIDSKSVLNLDSKALQKLAQDFYNDTYLYDQNACSSPRLIFWLGEAELARKRFWEAIYDYAKGRYELQDIIAIDKLVNECRVAINLDSVRIENFGNLINTIFVESLESCVEYVLDSGVESSEKSCVETALDSALDSSDKSALESFGVDSKLNDGGMLESSLDSAVKNSLKSSLESRVKSTLESTLESVLESALDSSLESAVETSFKTSVATLESCVESDVETSVATLESRVPKLSSFMESFVVPGGSFIESSGNSLQPLFNMLDSSFQTLSYFGLDSKVLRDEIIKQGIKGIDRILPVGLTSQFSLIWDGYDLITSLTRRIDRI